MNIGIFSDTYHPQINGVITSINTLKAQLEQRGHTVTIITVKTPIARKSEPGIFRIPSIPFRAFDGMRIGIFYPPPLIKAIRDLKLDIIHTQTEFTVGTFGRLMGKTLGIPVVHTYHTMYEDYLHYVAKTDLNRAILKKLVKKGFGFYMNTCGSIIAPTEKAKEAIEGYGVIRPIFVIPTGIEISSFAAEDEEDLEEQLLEIRKWLGIKKDDRVLLSLGRIAREKSIDVIISETAELLRTRKNLKLLIVGDGPEKANLEALVSRLRLGKSVIFTGWVEHSHAKYYYKLADAFISASTTETQGLTLYEAMAADTVVIAKYDLNLEGVLKDGVNSLIFHQDSQLREKVDLVFGNADLRERLRAEGQKTVQEVSAEKFGERVIKVYADTLQEWKENRKNKGLLKAVGRRVRRAPVQGGAAGEKKSAEKKSRGNQHGEPEPGKLKKKVYRKEEEKAAGKSGIEG